MKYILALTLLVCQSYCFAERDTNEFYDAGYRVRLIEYDGHEYLIVKCKRTNQFTILHYPECKTCVNWPVDISQYQGCNDILIYQDNFDIACVEMRNNGTYRVDPSGCVET